MIYRFGRHFLDTDSLELRADEEAITAEPQVFRLLQFLIENRDRVVSKDDIIETVWNGRIVSDSALTYAVKEARRILGDNGKAQTVIRTLPRRGFRFVADVIEEDADSISSLSARASLASGKPSVAVLPFDNMSDDPDQEYFSDGLVEDVITTLSKIERIRVIARNSTFVYKGQAIDLRRVAEELGVRYVLKGSVRRGGERLRVTAQLIDAADGGHLWAERYNRRVDDLFDIQDEIAKEIVTALRVRLTDGEEARVWSRGTGNIEAWEYCVRATELAREFTSSSYLEARALAEKAIELDPDYAQAWATLGITYWTDGRFGYTGDAAAKFARAAQIADRAMALDGSISWGISLGAVVAGALGRHQAGVEIARRGIDLYPGSADLRAFFAWALTGAGDYREAERQIRAATTLNPFYPNYYRGVLARALICLEEYEEALTLCDEALALEPAYLGVWLYRAHICCRTGRTADAKTAVAEIRRIAPDLRVGHVAGIFQVGDTEVLDRYLGSLREAGLPE